ncbi:centromere protein K isoform X2 [Numida meleagris]|uniref:centromere protein K isoform X2 n=1 Tax=Numida meleagris TaxID=8996 RepID=UPI000B3DD6A1|nr:centromere protein K isoform X2 [Numida meleagris]XP_021237267.1 centromere protein K isoform X2 [Numida meleagris]XP_021237268.1 centromere protein K isoform X2 [Numida meleagris]
MKEAPGFEAEKLPEIMNDSVCPVDAKEELLRECDNIWKEMEKCQSKLALLTAEPVPESDAKVSLLLTRIQALRAEYYQWQKRNPELISTNPEVLLLLGEEELQKVKKELEMVLSAVQSKNEKLKEDLEREQQWHDEQEQILNAFKEIEEEMKKGVVTDSEKRVFQELKNQMSELKEYKKKLMNALGEFLEEHLPLPEKNGDAKKKRCSEEPSEQLITMHEILEILLNQLMRTPHEPYVTVSDSFWPPYLELLLRSGIVLRHPEDPNRIRLEAFHE